MAKRLIHRLLQLDINGNAVDYYNSKQLEKFPQQFFKALIAGGEYREANTIYKVRTNAILTTVG